MSNAKSKGIKETIQKNMQLDCFICTVAVCVCAVAAHKQDAFVRMLLCGALAVLSDFSVAKLTAKKESFSFLSAASQGLIIALLLPYNVPFYVCFAAVFVAFFVASLPFGGSDKAPFVPCAVGVCFVYTLFSSQCFNFDGTSIAQMLKMGDAINLNVFSVYSVLCGNYPGAMGTTALLPLFGVAVYLLIRQKHKFVCFSGFVVAVVVFAAIFPRISGGILTSVVMELSAGSLVFTALFLLPESALLSRKNSRAFLFGAAGGLICMLLRYASPILDSAPFSVMILCAVWPLFINGKTKAKSKAVYKKAVKTND